MTGANLELCKELYELSGWVPERVSSGVWECGSTLNRGHALLLGHGDIPAYELGYLLRRLPQFAMIYKDASSGDYRAAINVGEGRPKFWADTPEDAACMLAIELLKRGYLKRDAA